MIKSQCTSDAPCSLDADVAEIKDMVLGRDYSEIERNKPPASPRVNAVNKSRCWANFQNRVSNSGYRPPMVSNQIRPPGFPPVPNPHANNQNRFQSEWKNYQSKQRINAYLISKLSTVGAGKLSPDVSRGCVSGTQEALEAFLKAFEQQCGYLVGHMGP
ncbi:hypothetical protein Tco_1292259 [Tanacetum coccineum]